MSARHLEYTEWDITMLLSEYLQRILSQRCVCMAIDHVGIMESVVYLALRIDLTPVQEVHWIHDFSKGLLPFGLFLVTHGTVRYLDNVPLVVI